MVLICTAGLLVAGCLGLARLRMEFRPEWLLDPQAEVTNWYFAHKEYFPGEGEGGQLYLRGVNYSENLVRLDRLVASLERESDIIRGVDSWHTQYMQFVEQLEDGTRPDWSNITEQFFSARLTQFLFSPRGAKYKTQFKFAEPGLQCGVTAPPILVSYIQYQHIGFR